MQKKLKIASAVVSLALAFSVTPQAQAQYEVGSTMFRDIILGSAVGAGVGVLVLVATQNSNNIATEIATAALIGAGAGFILGIVELSLDHSQNANFTGNEPGFKFHPIVTYDQNEQLHVAQGLQGQGNMLAQFDTRKLGGGLSLSYQFNR